MNSFNPDQKSHILSSPETPEGGTASGTRQQVPSHELGEEALPLEQPEGDHLDGEATSEGGEVEYTEVSADSLAAELDSLVHQEREASKPKFEVNEDGLSKQGVEIQDIESQIQQLESGEGDLVNSIRAGITESRQEVIVDLEYKKFKLEGQKKNLPI